MTEGEAAGNMMVDDGLLMHAFPDGRFGWGLVVKGGKTLWPPAPLRRDTIGANQKATKREWEVWVVKDGRWVVELHAKKPAKVAREWVVFNTAPA